MQISQQAKTATKETWKYLRYLPSFLRKSIIRSYFKINYDLSADYVFKQAESEEEIEAALQIIHESYLDQGITNQTSEKIHFNAFICLPTTSVLIIKYKEEVIGTMCIVLDSAFGLPSEKKCDVNSFRSETKCLAEVSSLTIKKSHKNLMGHLMLTLCKLMYDYCVENLTIDGIIISTTSEAAPFYTDLLLFEKISEEKDSAYCYLNLKDAKRKFHKEFGNKNKLKNLSYFFTEFVSPNISIPKKQLSVQGLLLKKNQAMFSLLKKYPDLNKIFSQNDKLNLSNLDPSSLIERAINFDTSHTTRMHPRVTVRNIKCFIYHPKTKSMIDGDLTEVSNQGFGIKFSKNLQHFDVHDNFVIYFELNGEALSINSQLRWNNQEKSGYLVQEKSRPEWAGFVGIVLEEVGLSINHRRIA